MDERAMVVVKRVTREHLDSLLLLLGELSPETEITRSSLERDLTSADELELTDAQQVLAQNDDPALELDLGLAKSNAQAMQGFLATAAADNEPLGLVLCHTHFSPWTGHMMAIKHVYVRAQHRNRGVAARLLEEVRSKCKQMDIKYLLYSVSKIPPALLECIRKHGGKVVRDDNSDWSVWRMDFECATSGSA